MRLKTFLAAYMLFLGILFVSIGIVSAHMTRSTTYMLREKAAREFQTISLSLARDMAAIFARFPGGYRYHMATNELFVGYVHYYRQNNIELYLTRMYTAVDGHANDSDYLEHDNLASSNDYTENTNYIVISFVQEKGSHFIYISGVLPLSSPLMNYQLLYILDISSNIDDMQGIQHFLWITSIVVSLVAAVLLYAVLLKIFKPLGVVTSAAQQIADGQYGNKLIVKGQNELASVAVAFNRMSQEIESQITQLEDDAERKQQFVDNFAHEIRTPLTSIYGYAEYLQKANLTEGELLESAGYIMAEADHMKNVANSLLELATLRNYKPEVNQIYIPELFVDIQQCLEKPLQERNVQMQTTVLTKYIMGQHDLIKSLILNLCNNAIASCDSDTGIVHLCATTEGQNVVIAIEDNGCGIPSDKLPKLTEPFFRIDKARSRDNGGTGLGLALVKQIADVHQAKMTIDSIEGVGTDVRLIFHE